jgi:hypothetical protein
VNNHLSMVVCPRQENSTQKKHLYGKRIIGTRKNVSRSTIVYQSDVTKRNNIFKVHLQSHQV